MAAEIDESLYSRQLYVMGREAQLRMALSNVFILGLDGLGVEIAKNVVLAGVKSVTLFDPTNVLAEDLGSQYYLAQSDIGKRRDESCISKIVELNPYVAVSCFPSMEISLPDLLDYKVIVVVNQPFDKQKAICDFCHGRGISVVVSNTAGVFGNIFCDFGESFTVFDTNGEQESNSMIASIILVDNNKAQITTFQETRHNLESGDVVTISDVEGITGLLDHHFTVRVIDPFSFEVDLRNLSCQGSYIRGGMVHQIKQPTTISFSSFSSSYPNPGMLQCDVCKYDRAELLHLCFKSMHDFKAKFGHFPRPWNQKDADCFLDVTQQLHESLSSTFSTDMTSLFAQSFVRKFSCCCEGKLAPICAILGGIAGQEVLKACSGKFSPIFQWYYFDGYEALPETLDISEASCDADVLRYGEQIKVFGKSMQNYLSNLNMLVVGAGAIGCEIMKLWAMMGISTCSGVVHITDPDHIEKSNLSRQFLFRIQDLEKSKSKTVASAVQKMNPSFKVIAYEEKVCRETEAVFNDDFFESLDMVCTALDNVEARLWVDQRCLFYGKPMLESGTLGSKGNTQVVVPGLTEHYGASRDPPEKSFPMCTIKSFPNQIEHTIQWGREKFEEIITQAVTDTNLYLQHPEQFQGPSSAAQQNVILESLLRIQDSLNNRPFSIEDCIIWARLKFDELFSHNILQLLHTYPLDAVTNSGSAVVPFWSGSKRPPTALYFDLLDDMHMEFLQAMIGCRAAMYGLTVDPDIVESRKLAGGHEPALYIKKELIEKVLSNAPVQVFVPKNISIPVTDEQAKSTASNSVNDSNSFSIDSQCNEIVRSLPDCQTLGTFALSPVVFDKDSDLSMRAVASIGNLRARNYRIPEIDLHRARGLAGNIIPAIATTTGLVAGTICLEIYKLAQKPLTGKAKTLEEYSNAFYNLAIPLFTSSHPEPPQWRETKIDEKIWKWNQWDRIDINQPNMSVGEFIDFMQTTYGVEIAMISSGVSIAYSSMLPVKKQKERKEMTVPGLIESVSKKEIPKNQKYLIVEVSAEDSDGNDIDIPYIRFRLF